MREKCQPVRKPDDDDNGDDVASDNGSSRFTASTYMQGPFMRPVDGDENSLSFPGKLDFRIKKDEVAEALGVTPDEVCYGILVTNRDITTGTTAAAKHRQSLEHRYMRKQCHCKTHSTTAIQTLSTDRGHHHVLCDLEGSRLNSNVFSSWTGFGAPAQLAYCTPCAAAAAAASSV